MEVTLLGTGTPTPSPVRAGPSQHLSIADTSVLIDCGSGVCRRMVECGLEPKDVDVLFVTHMHSDHTIDLAHVLLTGWIKYRTKPLVIVGPEYTREFVSRILHAFEADIALRKLHERVGDEVMNVEIVEVAGGQTFERDGWRATAVEVDHGYVKPALGFLFDDGAKKVMFSGDTTECEAVLEASRGADLLVHELTRGTPDGDPHGPALEKFPPLRQRVIESHTCPHQLGPLAREAGVPMLVATHMPVHPDASWMQEIIASEYEGEFIIGEDLLRLEV
ncbi:MAG: MBL fold metallo-hydrolase [Dehalococcoidia bacterium]